MKIYRSPLFLSIAFFVFFILFSVSLMSPTDSHAVMCRYTSEDPKWYNEDVKICNDFYNNPYVAFCTTRCNFCDGTSVCFSPSESNPRPGCVVNCGGDGTTTPGGNTPDKDMIWARIFTRDFNGNIRYFGPKDIPSTVNSSDWWNFRDQKVSIYAEQADPGWTPPPPRPAFEGIWAGRMCTYTTPIEITPGGTLAARRANSTSSSTAQWCRNRPDAYQSSLVSYNEFVSESGYGCSACVYNTSLYGQNCITTESDGCEQIANIGSIPSFNYRAIEDQDKRHPINKMFQIINHQQNPGESTDFAMHPYQRYDRTLTYTIIQAPENDEYRIKFTAPEGYYCYKTRSMVRTDGGVMNYTQSASKIAIYKPGDSSPGPADYSYCRATVDLQGGGAYLLLHVRKQIKGHVYGIPSSGPTVGLAGIRVQASVHNLTNGTDSVYYGEGTTDQTGEYFIRNDSMNLQNYRYYSVSVVPGQTPAGYTGEATTVKWDDVTRTSGNIGWSLNHLTGTDVPIGSSAYTSQSTDWDVDCSSNRRDGGLRGGRCDFAFRAPPPNRPPTCSIQYRNSSGIYVNYDNNLTWNSSQIVNMRHSFTDPDGDVINNTSMSLTCGSVMYTSFNSNYNNFNYTNPSTSATCILTGYAYDGKDTGPGCSVTIRSIATQAGSLILRDATPIQKLLRTGTIDAVMSGYVNQSTPATLTINQNGICVLGTCRFQSSGNRVLTTYLNQAHRINILLSYSSIFGYVLDRGGNYPISVNYSPNSSTVIGSIHVIDNPPSCTNVVSGPGPYSRSINYNVSASDDWSLRGFGASRLQNSSLSYVRTASLYQSTYWQIRFPVTRANDVRSTEDFNIDVATLPDGNYRLSSRVFDTLNQPGQCDSPWFTIDNTAPTCTNTEVIDSGGNIITNPIDSSPLRFRSTARDATSSLTRVTFYVVPTATPIASIITDSVYSNSVTLSSLPVGTPITITSSAPGWVTTNVQRGIYTVYAQWFDAAGNVPNGLNNCSTNVEIGTRYRVNVTVPSDSGFSRARFEDNTTEFKFLARRNSEPWPALESTTPVPVGSISTGCRAQYPNGNPADDHGSCDSVYVTDTVFGIDDSSNIAVLIPGGVAGSKYVCNQMTLSTSSGGSVTYNSSQLRIFTHSDGQTYCTLNDGISFRVQRATNYPVFSGTGVLTNASQAYPTEITIQLSYRTDAISGMIFDKNQNIIQPPIIPNGVRPNATYLNQAGVGRYFVLPGQTAGNFDASTFWVSPGNASFTINAGIDNMCFYEANVSSGLPTNNVSSIISKLKARNSVLSYSPNCSISNYPLTHNVLSPVNQNKMNILVGPRIRIGPSDIDFVPNIDSCNNDAAASAFPYDMTATLSVIGNSEPGLPHTVNIPANTGTYNFNGVTLNFASSYNILFALNTSDSSISLSDFAVCNDNNRANPYVFSPMDNNSSSYFNIDNSNYGINYPNVSGAIQAPIRFYLKESNKWWQVYNGGVHSNTQLQIDSNDGSGDGMPSQAVIVGDPRPLGHELPEGYDMYTALGISETPFIAGGLVSSFSFDPTSFDQFGLSDIAQINNWNTVDFTTPSNGPLLFGNSIENVFLAVKDHAQKDQLGYKETTSLNSSIRKNKSYFVSDTDETINSTININQPSDPTNSGITTFVDLGGSNTLTIRKDINTGTNILIVYVNGDVLIDPDVSVLNSVIIVATGQITIESRGDDQDDPLIIRGGLYANNVVFSRDLEDTVANFLSPSSMVMFDQKSVIYSKNTDFASEIKESKVYWILKE